MKYLTILAFLWLTGCSMSVQELRQEAPSKAVIISGSYDEVGSCIAYEMQSSESSEWETSLGSLTYEVIDQKARKLMTITGRFSWRNLPLIDVTVSSKNGGSLVEVRRPGHRGGRKAEEKTWPIVERCAIR